MRLLATALFSLLFAPLLACAEPAKPTYQEGQHYHRIESPVRTRSDRIEVHEIFWYGCPHCFQFQPVVKTWAKKLPDDVAFVQSPAMWNQAMRIHARAFYTAVALDKLDVLHDPLFEALNVQNRRLASEGEIQELFVSHGVDAEEFRKAFNSFGVGSQVNQADARARGFRISGTPELVVAGKYRITARGAGGFGGMLRVVDYLIEKERTEREQRQAATP